MKMNQVLLLTMSCLCVGLTACTNKSSNKATPTVPVQLAPVQPAAESTVDTTAVLPPSGKSMGESTVSSRAVIPGQSSSGSPAMTLEEILAAYPTLADRNAFLASIDKVVETDARTFDLYAGNVLVLSLSHGTDANSLVVAQSTNSFTADVISYTMVGNPQDQSEAVGTLFFQVSACKAGTPVPDPGQDKGQDKEPKPVADVCHSIETTLSLAKVVQKPGGDQDQGKDTPKP